jgi:hypothetical protein
MAYATKTSVSVDRSRSEIEQVLRRYGADQFSFGSDDSRGLAVIRFRAHDRTVQFVLRLPEKVAYRKTPTGLQRTAAAVEKEWEQACRSRWRALLLCIRGKLEAVESQITEFEEEFLAHIILPDGKTAGDWLRPQIAVAYESNKMPRNLLALPAPD